MVDENFQNDFFGDQANAKKSIKSRLSDKYSKQRFLPQIKIPIESIEKIDDLIRSGKTLYTSRDDFIKSAVQMKLRELKDLDSK